VTQPPTSRLFPYPTLFRSQELAVEGLRGLDGAQTVTVEDGAVACRRLYDCVGHRHGGGGGAVLQGSVYHAAQHVPGQERPGDVRSEEHTSELQSRENLVCR